MVEIAEILGVHFSTLYREIRRNRQRDGEYHSFAAQEQALARRRIPRRVSQGTAENEPWVDQPIDKDLSPDVIAGRAKQTGVGHKLSAGTIDKMIEKNRRNGGQMVRKLPRQGRKYRKNRTGPPGKGKLKVRKGQDLVDRPQGVNERREPGHVEIEQIFSGETIWLTCVDRHTRHLRLRARAAGQSERTDCRGSLCLAGKGQNQVYLPGSWIGVVRTESGTSRSVQKRPESLFLPALQQLRKGIDREDESTVAALFAEGEACTLEHGQRGVGPENPGHHERQTEEDFGLPHAQ